MTRDNFLLSMALLAFFCGLTVEASGSESVPAALHWYRGNTHTHTINSDGNATPDVVVRWYREHGYHFVVITDHEFLTDVEGLNAVFGAEGRFLVMRGQEVTQWSHNVRQSAAHVNAINSKTVVYPVGEAKCVGSGCGRHAPADMPLSATFAANISGIKTAGGIAQINHPNYRWSVKPEDLFNVPDRTLLEIWNGIPDINNLGGTDDAGNLAPSAEAVWDILLSRGQILWGVGSDDSHEYYEFYNPNSARPGQAWIVVRAGNLSSESIVAALTAGDFYASTGITLADLRADQQEIALEIKAAKGSGGLASRYVTRFVSHHGKVVAEVFGTKPRYVIRGDEGYVRASITDSNGLRAWTQPVFVGGGDSNRR